MDTDTTIATLEDTMNRYGSCHDGRIQAWPIIIGHTCCSEELWKASKELSIRHGTGMSFHMSPAAMDVEGFMATFGQRPMVHLAEIGVLGDNVILTHAVHVDDTEIALLAETGTSVSHCPTTALKVSYGVTQIGKFPEMVAAGVNVAIGTDGNNASNYHDLIRATYLVAGLFKDAPARPEHLPRRGRVRDGHAKRRQGSSGVGRVRLDRGRQAGRPRPARHEPTRVATTAQCRRISSCGQPTGAASTPCSSVVGSVVDDYRCTTIDEDDLLRHRADRRRRRPASLRPSRPGEVADRLTSSATTDSIKSIGSVQPRMSDVVPEPIFLAAARGEATPTTPVWFMRQAGRSLPEYRAVRGEGSILDAIKRPSWLPRSRCSRCAATASTPLSSTPTSSSLRTPSASASTWRRVPGRSPRRRSGARADLDRLRPLEPGDIGYVAETVGILADTLSDATPVLAFAGAPFTVASYLIEGRPSRTYEHTKALMRGDTALWHDLMDRLAAMAITFIETQLDAGAQRVSAVRLVGRRAGDAADYDRYVLPHSRRVFGELATRHRDAPGIHFGIGCDHLLESMVRGGPGDDRARLAHLDLRRPQALRRPHRRAGQPRPVARPRRHRARAARHRRDVLADNAGRPGHIFNLGHGVHPGTDPDVLARGGRVRARVHVAMTTRHRAETRAAGVVVMAYGTPGHAGRTCSLLHRHPARPAADRGAARRPDPPLRRDRRSWRRLSRVRSASTRERATQPAIDRGTRRRLRGRDRAQARRPDASRTPSPAWR